VTESRVGEPHSDTGEPAEPPRPSLAHTPSPWRTAFFGLAIVGIVAGVAWALLGSRLLVVRSVVVTGTHLVPAGQVQAAAAIPAGEAMVRVDTGAVAGRVDTITQVESAQVTKSWPNRIVIAVHERTPAVAVPVPASVSASGGYDLVDPSGVIVRWARTVPRGMPVYSSLDAPGALRGNPALIASVTVLHQVPAWISRWVTTVAASSPQAVTLWLAGGVTIVWGSPDRASAKARELAILMPTHARYYDVSAPGSAVTR
jgi:cell division protein FtsQ